jgi:uncharacterized protein YbjT (DUF2867 family)
VERVVHISITNPSCESSLQYFHGKAANEAAVLRSGLSYAILRPTVLFGREDILINNIAYFVRRFPVFLVPGDGLYRLQPVYVDDVAELAANAAHATTNETTDAVGPEVFTFKGLVLAIGTAVGRRPRLISVPASLALAAARALGLFLGDVVLTSQEVEGLMANLLLPNHTPRCTTRLTAWLNENSRTLGSAYASELRRHY